jgi:hypothetical protein
MATMDPGQRGFGRQRQFNIPGLPFDIGADPLSQMRPRPRGGMRPQGQIPPQLLQMLMAQLMAGQGGGRGGPQRMARGARGRQRPMGGGRPPQRPPMGGGRPPQRPPMGGGRPPVIKIEDLVRAISGQGGGRRRPPQANMAVPQAPR